MEIFNVLAAASASFVFGAVWYMVLSDPWMTASGVARDADGKPLNSSNPRPYILSAIFGDCGRRDDAPCARGQWRDLNSFGRDCRVWHWGIFDCAMDDDEQRICRQAVSIDGY